MVFTRQGEDRKPLAGRRARGGIAGLDADGSGRIGPEEFLKAVRRFYTS
ncbi:EF-hand domain-containing protein [Streptomyces sp. HU2014]|nr:EF-hand domain-containing protein [Streptomyces sp. HU2014]UQI46349.1 EF-hand domain-containing protein [Streptomyces sp. HU2014]